MTDDCDPAWERFRSDPYIMAMGRRAALLAATVAAWSRLSVEQQAQLAAVLGRCRDYSESDEQRRQEERRQEERRASRQAAA